MIYLSTFLNGLTIAGYLFLMALGLNLSFGLMNIVNMSHGTMYLAGGFISPKERFRPKAIKNR